MRILIISKTIYPEISPRSFRTTELAKELALQGHEVIVYAVLGCYDYSHFEEKYNLKIGKIGPMKFATYNSDGKARNKIFDKISRRLFEKLLEYPDIEFMIEIPKIIITEKKFDLLISIASPHPINWGCALAKKLHPNNFPRIWIADCSDPYFGNTLFEGKKPFYFKYIESWFCKSVDFITIPLEGARNGYFPDFHWKIKVIPQGLKIENFKICVPYVPNKVVTFAYAGQIYKGIRDPTSFLNHLTNIQNDFLFIVYTRNIKFFQKFKRNLGDKLQIFPYIAREDLIYNLSKVDFLINLSNGTNLQSPSKLIDYALTERPVLIVSTPFYEIDTFHEFLNHDYKNKMDLQNKDQYDIRHIAKKFTDLITDEM